MLEKVYGKNTQILILVCLGMEGKVLTDDEVPADNFRHWLNDKKWMWIDCSEYIELNMYRQAESTFSLRPEYEESSYQHVAIIFSEL